MKSTKTGNIEHLRTGAKYAAIIEEASKLGVGYSLVLEPPEGVTPKAYRNRLNSSVRPKLRERANAKYVFRVLSDGTVAICLVSTR